MVQEHEKAEDADSDASWSVSEEDSRYQSFPKRNDRPKSARPTRDSKFPVGGDFSDVGSVAEDESVDKEL